MNVKPQSKLSGALRSTSHACQLSIEGHVHVVSVGESPATHDQKSYLEKQRLDELLSGVLVQRDNITSVFSFTWCNVI